MRTIFLSYRRDDSEGQAGRLFDDLVEQFGADSVFMDVAGIEAGRDFRKVIDQHVASCGVLLAMIGKNWTDATDEQGRRRLDDPMDFVRLEIASALKRDIPVIPVLVQRANMPSVAQLPADLEGFAYRNAVELTHARWDSDVQVLVKALRPYVDDAQPGTAVSPGLAQEYKSPEPGAKQTSRTVKSEPSSPTGKSWRTYILGAMALLAILAGGFSGLKTYMDAAGRRTEQERLAHDKAAAEKQAMEAELEKARLEALKAKTEADRQTEQERQAHDKAVAQKQAMENELEKTRQEALKAKARLEALAKAETDRLAREKAAAEKLASEVQSRSEAAARAEKERLAIANKERVIPPRPLIDTTPSNTGQLTAWMSEPDFNLFVRSQPAGRKFPYDFEGRCRDDGRIELRARLGPLPKGASRFFFGTMPFQKYEQQANARKADGYTVFSRQSCKFSSGRIFVQSVFIK